MSKWLRKEIQFSRDQVKETSLDSVSQVCKVKERKTRCLGMHNTVEQTGNNFEKILGFGILVQHGDLYDL